MPLRSRCTVRCVGGVRAAPAGARPPRASSSTPTSPDPHRRIAVPSRRAESSGRRLSPVRKTRGRPGAGDVVCPRAAAPPRRRAAAAPPRRRAGRGVSEGKRDSQPPGVSEADLVRARAAAARLSGTLAAAARALAAAVQARARGDPGWKAQGAAALALWAVAVESLPPEDREALLAVADPRRGPDRPGEWAALRRLVSGLRDLSGPAR